MSNQDPQNQDKINEDADVQKRRRFIKGASLAAPVVLTLANRPVFGAAQCFSQQMSGNMSHIGEGSCELGENPFAWRGSVPHCQPIPIIGNVVTNITQKDRSEVVKDEEMINMQVIAYIGSSSSGTPVKIVQNIKVIKQTYYWYGTSFMFMYGDLFTTEINTRIFRGTNFTTNVFEEITVKDVIPAGSNVDKYTPPQVVVGAKFKTGTQWAYTNAEGTKNPDPTTPLPLTIWPSGYSLVTPYPAKCFDFAVDTGTTMETAFLPTTGASKEPMRKILCADATSLNSYFVAAMLNASYQPSINYVMTVNQVKELYANPSAYVNDVKLFLASTWETMPSC